MTRPVRLTDQRLAWLAARDYIFERATHLHPLSRILMVITLIASVGRSNRVRRESIKEKVMDYNLAVDDLADRLSNDERAKLRATNTLPDWFYPAVEEAYQELRRRRRDF